MASSTASAPAPAARPRAGLTGIRLWYALLWLAGAFGLAAWIYELHYGLAATGMRDVVSWGMYIFTFAFFIGLSAGGLIMASSAEVFGIADLKPLARLGVLSAAGCVTVAAIMILPDLGQPGRILNIVIHPNWTSPLVWDILIISAYFAFSVLDLAVLQRHETQPGQLPQGGPGARLHRAAHRRAAALDHGLDLRPADRPHVVEHRPDGAAVRRVGDPVRDRPGDAAGAGRAALGRLRAAGRTRHWLRGFIAVALIVDLFFVGCDYITVLWGNVPADRSALDLVLPGGPYAWTFWVEWIAGGLVPLAFLLVPRLRRVPGSLGIAAALAVVGVYAFRIELVVIGFINPLTQFPPGNALGTFTPGATSFQLVGRYWPTWVEYSIVLGLFALFGAIMTVGYRRLIKQPATVPAEDGPQ